ncbi:hypothetical protein HJG60_011132 [Phyllostomus discolor]|uniref:Uncharacterized protein n=1 Tax=Phyllostomus discolor TaxID=89673 RepID=A0A834A450_9CHIR|nr:hypothetical protein HJG60_011132 [Phyllostomus discolor]
MAASLLPPWHALLVPIRGCVPLLVNCSLEKVSVFTALQTGDSCWQWRGGSELLLTRGFWFLVFFAPPDSVPWPLPGVCNSYIYKPMNPIYKIPAHPGQSTSKALGLGCPLPVVGGPQFHREDCGVGCLKLQQQEGKPQQAGPSGETGSGRIFVQPREAADPQPGCSV